METPVLEKRLGKGSFGEAWTATYGGVPVVVKVPVAHSSRQRTPEEQARRQAEAEQMARDEYAIVSRLDHPNIVRAVAQFRDGSFALERMTTSLYDYHSAHALTMRQIVTYAAQIASALRYLAEHNVVHLDLKSDNVLLGAPDAGGVPTVAKLNDFGTSRALVDDVAKMHHGWCTPPEANTSRRIVNRKSDVFTFGSLLYDLIYHRIACRTKYVFDPALPNAVNGLIHACHADAPADRPDFPTIIRFLARLLRAPSAAAPPVTTTVRLSRLLDAEPNLIDGAAAATDAFVISTVRVNNDGDADRDGFFSEVEATSFAAPMNLSFAMAGADDSGRAVRTQYPSGAPAIHGGRPVPVAEYMAQHLRSTVAIAVDGAVLEFGQWLAKGRVPLLRTLTLSPNVGAGGALIAMLRTRSEAEFLAMTDDDVGAVVAMRYRYVLHVPRAVVRLAQAGWGGELVLDAPYRHLPLGLYFGPDGALLPHRPAIRGAFVGLEPALRDVLRSAGAALRGVAGDAIAIADPTVTDEMLYVLGAARFAMPAQMQTLLPSKGRHYERAARKGAGTYTPTDAARLASAVHSRAGR